MINSIYAKLAFYGIRKNGKIYVPYIIASIGMVSMCYIMNYLALTPFIEDLRGIDAVREMFKWGSIIVSFFAGIFLFYTNGFIVKNRKKEFGLYNVLGMNKRNIGVVLFLENLVISIFTIALGILIGVLFSKLSELFLLNLIKAPVNYSFRIPKGAIVNILKVYGIIFLVIMLNGIRQVNFSSTISMLNSQREGEKPPKGSWILGCFGAVMLGIGYYLAVTIKDPATALFMFFVAVLFVIVGTYFVMIYTSVLICNCLKKSKKYYYNKNHFISVSSMAYRMKRTGASLGSICILLTMILVTLSTTGSLYFQVEDMLKLYHEENWAIAREQIYGVYGGFLGLGIIVSVVFTIGAVLLIYYKQISEGYEDKASFVVMKKIGMTDEEIRKNVNSQLVVVILLPVVLAGLHLIFAFPMLKIILNMFVQGNNKLFFQVSVIGFLCTMVVYMIVYKLVSREYLRITK